tara:strand:- start:279 stop:488 length:210 start_codon:yes stop_codon:yes gene_type:complete
MEMTEESKNQKEKEQEENQIVELLKGIEDTQLKIIKVLNRIERNFLSKDEVETKPMVDRPPFYYHRKRK